METNRLIYSVAGKPMAITYINKQELVRFMEGNDSIAIGLSYTWEDEGVTHLHLRPLRHAFGSVGSVFFVKGDKIPDCNEGNYLVNVSIGNNGETEVLVRHIINGILVPLEVSYIPSREELYSRNKGILELNILENKSVLIIGLGSFGSQIAIELAKAGVGHFSLMDFDRVELHNLARHTCVTQDLGRLKTDTIEDAILGKNPYAQVVKFPVDVNCHLNLLEQQVEQCDLVIIATDNNQSRLNITNALLKAHKVGIFGRAITRAEGGDVFRYRPGGPCYNCLIGARYISANDEEIADEASARRSGRIPAYMSARDADAAVQVGLSADIQPICNMMIKLALVELSRGTQSGITSLENDFTYDFYIWANRREHHYANWFALPQAGPKPTIMRWYGVRVERDDHCPLCSQSLNLDAGQSENLDLEGMENINLDDLT